MVRRYAFVSRCDKGTFLPRPHRNCTLSQGRLNRFLYARSVVQNKAHSSVLAHGGYCVLSPPVLTICLILRENVSLGNMCITSRGAKSHQIRVLQIWRFECTCETRPAPGRTTELAEWNTSCESQLTAGTGLRYFLGPRVCFGSRGLEVSK